MRLTFRSQRGERPLRHVRNGELTRSVGLHGIYRLSRDLGGRPGRAGRVAAAATPRIPRPRAAGPIGGR